jgi:hypothetical protein
VHRTHGRSATRDHDRRQRDAELVAAVEEERRRQHWAAEIDAALACREADRVQAKERRAECRCSVAKQRHQEHAI